MKNILMVMTLMFVGTFAAQSYAGECSDGLCGLLNRPVRKVVSVTKSVVVAPVRVAREVVKCQPVRRRLVNRSVNCVSCQ